MTSSVLVASSVLMDMIEIFDSYMTLNGKSQGYNGNFKYL